jgi:cysteine desulfuration protein SufE
MERYEYIIQSKSLPLIKDEFKTDSNVIKGCQSKVWLQGENTMKKSFSPQTVIFNKGIIAILIRTFQIKPLSLF